MIKSAVETIDTKSPGEDDPSNIIDSVKILIGRITNAQVLSELRMTLFSHQTQDAETQTDSKFTSSLSPSQDSYSNGLTCGFNSNAKQTPEAWELSTLAKDVTEIAEEQVQSSGFIYDVRSNTYYDQFSQCHYIPELKLYYYQGSNAYYYFDHHTCTLQHYWSGDVPSTSTSEQPGQYPCEGNIENPDNQDTMSKRKTPVLEIDEEKKKIKCAFEEKEEGECSDSDSGECGEPTILCPAQGTIIIESGPKPYEPDPENHIASCIRIVVTDTHVKSLNVGTLFIITCKGGTLGREGDHDIIIPEKSVSKCHAEFIYEFTPNGCDSYKIIDVGSQNGTFVDGKRLSSPQERSEPHNLIHGTVIKVGSTELLCHIHSEKETCEHCEPGCVMSTSKKEDASKPKVSKTLDEQHKEENQRLKSKFGLRESSGVTSKVLDGYKDRSKERRELVGSSHDSEKTQASSVDEPLRKENKGYKMLAKMGWEEGKCIGKGVTFKAITTPLAPETKLDKAGVGCVVMVANNQSKDEVRRALIWQKTRQRYLKALRHSRLESEFRK